MPRIIIVSMHLQVTVSFKSPPPTPPVPPPSNNKRPGLIRAASTSSFKSVHSPALPPSDLFRVISSASCRGSPLALEPITEQDYFSPVTITLEPPASETKQPNFEEKGWMFQTSYLRNGGLHNAITSAADAYPNILRVGTLGICKENIAESTLASITDSLLIEKQSVPVWLDEEIYMRGYSHFSKQVLWRLLHYSMSDFLKCKGWESEAWNAYTEMNKTFLEVVLSVYEPGDTSTFFG